MLLVFGLAVATSTRVCAYELGERVSLNGVASLAGQCQRMRNDGGEDRCAGALAFQPSLTIRPGEAHRVFFKVGLASGNGLNDVTPFNIAPWAADLQDLLENINGRGRQYLLTAWYRFDAELDQGNRIGLTVGLIDATDYLDANVFSNDEYTQFMNSALVNGPNVFVPSYAPGLEGHWNLRRLSLTAVYMNVGRADADSFEFFGVEAGYRLDTPLGPGNYRVLLESSSPDFPDPSGTSRVRRAALLFSCDQQLGASVGVFVRISIQDDDPAIDYRSLYSGGVDIGGTRWGRPRDNIGLGLAYLKGGNTEIGKTRIAEAYYRVDLTKALAISGDLQYMSDDLEGERGPEGWILGLRLTTQF